MSPAKSKNSKTKPKNISKEKPVKKAVKISAKNTEKIKGKIKGKQIDGAEENSDLKEEGDVESFPAKGKKEAIVAIDEHVEVDIPEEKALDEVLVKPEDVEDLLADELTLDDDELNPFGDKWEE